MTRTLHREIERLERRLLAISALAEDNVHQAIRAVQDRDGALAERVIAADVAIDENEVALEEDCLKELALHQPVASDLRRLIVVLKVNNDLERIGDCATSIARRAAALAQLPAVPLPFDVGRMARQSSAMVRQSVAALVEADRAMAAEVRRLDKQVDALHRDNYCRVSECIAANLAGIDTYLAVLTVSRALERIADHATNIAEDVIYLLDGEIVRHDKGGRAAAAEPAPQPDTEPVAED